MFSAQSSYKGSLKAKLRDGSFDFENPKHAYLDKGSNTTKNAPRRSKPATHVNTYVLSEGNEQDLSSNDVYGIVSQQFYTS